MLLKAWAIISIFASAVVDMGQQEEDFLEIRSWEKN
jgi:hypothetical protein